MKLPNGSRAVVDEEKILYCLLDPLHSEGRHHARLFRRLLGIGREDWATLRDVLLHHAEHSEVQPGQRSPHGTKYELRFTMTGKSGTHTILSVWMIRHGEDFPRLVTAYVE